MLNELLVALILQLAQPAQAPSIAFDPPTPGATDVHWTITLGAPYCGGFRIGDGVYLRPEVPLALPATISSDAVLFDGEAADVSFQRGVLRVAPSPTLAHPMFCQQGDRQFTVELLSSLGLTNPDPGDYAVDVWLGAGGTPLPLPVTIIAPSTSGTSAGRCDPLKQRVDQATAVMQADNTALDNTFDAIRAQAAQVATQFPELASLRAELTRQLQQAQATGRANAAGGYNPSTGYAAPIIDWAAGAAAQGELAALQKASVGPDGVQRSSVVSLISVVQFTQQQAEHANTDSFQLTNVLQQFADCGFFVPPAPGG